MEKYIADKQVMAVVSLDEKTPAGNNMVCVNFTDGIQEVMPEMRYHMISTNKISDASSVQTVVRNHVGSYLLGVLHEFGIKMGEADMVLNSAGDAVNLSYERARDLKWGNVTHAMLPLIEVNKILVEHANKNNDGATSVGSESN